MSRKTHEKELARARARRQAERAGHQRTRRTLAAGIVVVVAIAAIAIGLALQGGDDGDDPAATDAATGSATETGQATTAPADDDAVAPTDAPATEEPDDGATGAATTTDAAPCENPSQGAPEPDTARKYDDPPPADDVADAYTVTMTTTCGEIVLELDGQAASQTVASFVFLAEEGYYAGVPFHRVQDQFVIQGGDPTGTGSGGPGYQFEDELELAQQVVADNDGLYPRGTLAMANAGPDTNGSQFFIVQADPGYRFPPAYTIFGEVVEGMGVVDRIAQGPVTGANQDQAVDPVRIVSVEVAEG